MDTRDLYKIVVALDRKAKAAPVKKECGCGGNCKCNKSQVTESRNVLNLLWPRCYSSIRIPHLVPICKVLLAHGCIGNTA